MRASTIDSDAVRIAHIERDRAMYAETVGLLKDLARNPVVELVGTFLLVEKLQRDGVLSEGLFTAGTTIEAAVTGIIVAQQIAPLMPDIVKSAGGLASALALVPKI